MCQPCHIIVGNMEKTSNFESKNVTNVTMGGGKSQKSVTYYLNGPILCNKIRRTIRRLINLL